MAALSKDNVLDGIEINSVAHRYLKEFRRKYALLAVLFATLIVLALCAVFVGQYDLSLFATLNALLGRAEAQAGTVLWNIRLPRILAALVAGWGLGLSGLAMQNLLKNPLASPFTLGISQGAAFGAALAIVTLGNGPIGRGALSPSFSAEVPLAGFYTIPACALLWALAATGAILLLAKLKKLAPLAVILAGVALSSLFFSGLVLIQYLATEVELAAIVFWTFGDVARATWKEIAILTAACMAATLFFVFNQWNLNALSGMEDLARGLGVDVEKIRLRGMFMAAVLSSLITAFCGVIAFLGLLAPHIARRLAGTDHRLLIPYCGVVGALLLLLADTAGRFFVGSGALPVGVLTSFLGAPIFLGILLRGTYR